MKKTQLDVLIERRDEALQMISDPVISRTEFLKHFSSSTKALYKFMEIEKVSWSRKPHDGTNQFTTNPVEVVEKTRIKVASGEKVNDLIFNSESSLLSSTGVYRIVSASGGVYIGMAAMSFRRRFYSHKIQLNAGSHHCAGLQRAFNQDPNCFFEVLEVIEDRNLIQQREQDVWVEYKERNIKLYNGEPGGDGVTVFHTEETKQRLSEIAKKRSALSESKIEELRVRLCINGESINSLKKELKVADKTIRKLIKENSWDTSHEARAKIHIETILERGRNGDLYRDISRDLRIHRDVIRDILKSNNLIYEMGEVTAEQKEIIVDLYSKKGFSMNDIAWKINVSQGRIQSYLGSVNAEKGIEGVWRRDKTSGEIIINPDRLIKLRKVDSLTSYQIAEELNLDFRIVSKNLKKLDKEITKEGDTPLSSRKSNKKVLDLDLLEKLYWIDCMNIQEIADMMNVSFGVIQKNIKEISVSKSLIVESAAVRRSKRKSLI